MWGNWELNQLFDSNMKNGANVGWIHCYSGQLEVQMYDSLWLRHEFSQIFKRSGMVIVISYQKKKKKNPENFSRENTFFWLSHNEANRLKS